MIKRFIFTLILLAIFIPNNVFAVSVEQQRLMNSGIYYHDIDAGSEVCNPGTINTQGLTNSDYAGREIFSAAQLEQISLNQPFYVKAANEFDIPWQVIAAIHLREYGLKRENPSNGQGIYQFYNKAGGPYPTGPVSDDEFQRQTDFMAEQLKNDYFQRTPVVENREVSATSATPAAVKDMFFSYNGRNSGYKDQAAALGFDREAEGYEGSPYVMNKADQQRDPEFNTTTWGQVKRDRGPIEYPANNDYGAFVQYAALAGVGGSCGGIAAGSIVEIARRELVLGANEADGSYHKYTGGVDAPWCGYFLSWVLNEAGTPFEGGTIAAVQGILDYARQNNLFYEKDDPNFQPQPGDVVIYKEGLSPYPSHVNIVVGYDAANNTVTTIGGNESNTIREQTWEADMAAITGYMRLQ